MFQGSRSGVMRRPEESVAGMGVAAARECLDHAGIIACDLGMVLVSSASSERRFPGPASTIAHALGIDGVPAIDLPIASAGGLFGMAIAAPLSAIYGNVLVIASEKMSVHRDARASGTGRCAAIWRRCGSVPDRPEDGRVRIIDSVLHSDGAFAEDLRAWISTRRSR